MTCCSVCRYLKSAMHPQLRSWAITPGTTTSLGWSRQTPTKHRPWSTSWQPWGGTMSQHWLLKATMERVVWRPSPRSPEKLVSVRLSGLVFIAAELQSIAEFWWGVCSVIRTPVGVLPALKGVILPLACLPRCQFWQLFKKRGKKYISLWPFWKGAAPWWLRGKKQPEADLQPDLRKCSFDSS